MKKYKKKLNQKNKNEYDIYFLKEVNDSLDWHSLENDYLTIDSLNTFPIDLVTEMKKVVGHIIKDKKRLFRVCRLKNTPGIVDTMISNMRSGISKRYLLCDIVVKDTIMQYKEYIKKPYTYGDKEIDLKLEIYINDPIKKIIDFLENEYIHKSKNK